MPAFEGAILTVIREGVWDAITHGQDTAEVFHQFKNDGDPNKLPKGPTGYNDIPAVMVEPTEAKNEWASQRFQDYDYFLDVLIFDRTKPDIEGSWEQIYKAIVRTVDEETNLPYCRGYGGKTPDNVGTVFDEVAIGEKKKLIVWTCRMTLGFRTQFMVKP